MDILAFIANNSEMLLMSLSVVLAFIARYFQQESKVLYDAGQALIALEQEILNSVKDGIVTQDELDTLIIKIQVAEKALQDALAIFVKPASVVQTSGQKIAMLFGVSDVQAKTNVIKEQIVTLKAQRTEKLARMQRRISQQKTP
jgi:hypothetical protein